MAFRLEKVDTGGEVEPDPVAFINTDLPAGNGIQGKGLLFVPRNGGGGDKWVGARHVRRKA